MRACLVIGLVLNVRARVAWGSREYIRFYHPNESQTGMSSAWTLSEVAWNCVIYTLVTSPPPLDSNNNSLSLFRCLSPSNSPSSYQRSVYLLRWLSCRAPGPLQCTTAHSQTFLPGKNNVQVTMKNVLSTDTETGKLHSGRRPNPSMRSAPCLVLHSKWRMSKAYDQTRIHSSWTHILAY